LVRDNLSSFVFTAPVSVFLSQNCQFKFNKRSQLFIRSHTKTLSIVAMRVGNEDCSPVAIHTGNTAPPPPGFAVISVVFRCSAVPLDGGPRQPLNRSSQLDECSF
jgi:hypothetical protein